MRPTNEILLAKNRTTAVLYFQPFLDPERDLSPTPNAGSFYIVSYVESGGNKFTHCDASFDALPQIGNPARTNGNFDSRRRHEALFF